MRPDPVHIRLGPDTHPPDERVAAWRAALGFSHDITVLPEDRADFRASFDGFHLGAVLIADMRAGPLTATRDDALIARHALDAIALDIFQEGGLAGRFGSTDVAVGPGDCVLMDVRDTMHIEVTRHRCVTLIVPRPLFAQRVGRPGPVGGRVLRAETPEARLLGGQLEHLLAVAPDLPEALAEAAGLAFLDLLAACLGAAPGRPARARRRNDKEPVLARVERLIERELARPTLGSALICRRLKLSRSTLYRLMQPLGGLMAVVRGRRTAAAYRLLTTGEERGLTVPEVAKRCGFGDVQALRRALRDSYGASPRELRRTQPADEAMSPPLDPTTSAWIDAEPEMVVDADTAP